MVTNKRLTRKKRIRAKIVGTGKRPRLAVFRSNKLIYAQMIDDAKGVTIAEAHGADAKKAGSEIAKKAGVKKIKEVVFDRGGYNYHGKVKSLADAAREGGLKF